MYYLDVSLSPALPVQHAPAQDSRPHQRKGQLFTSPHSFAAVHSEKKEPNLTFNRKIILKSKQLSNHAVISFFQKLWIFLCSIFENDKSNQHFKLFK